MNALQNIAELSVELGEKPLGAATGFDLRRLEWFDLRNMVPVARMVAQSALNRKESRGAHQREDFPLMLPNWRGYQTTHLAHGEFRMSPFGTGSREGTA